MGADHVLLGVKAGTDQDRDLLMGLGARHRTTLCRMSHHPTASLPNDHTGEALGTGYRMRCGRAARISKAHGYPFPDPAAITARAWLVAVRNIPS